MTSGITYGELEQEVAYFFREGRAWSQVIEAIDREKEVSHLHLYLDTAIDPRDLERLIRADLQARSWKLSRRVSFIPGPGYVNIYNIHPEGKAHFEVIARHAPNKAIELTPEGATHKDAGRNFAYWTRENMSRFYEQYELRTVLTEDDHLAAERYFSSDAWRAACDLMTEPHTLHCHAQVFTSLHPRLLGELGSQALRALDWQPYWWVDVVYQPGSESPRPKIVYLVSRPETQMEIEWVFDADSRLEAHHEPLTQIKTRETTQQFWDELRYQRLPHDSIRRIIAAIQQG